MYKNRKEMLEMDMKSVFIKMALPAMAGMVAVGLYNLVDAIFIGQFVSAEGVGAVVISYNVVLLNMAVAMLFAMGATSLLSRAIGENDNVTIKKIFGNVLIGVSLLSIIITFFVYIFAEPILSFIGAKDEILFLATKYLKTLSIGFIFSALGPALNFLIRGEGQMKSAMGIIVSGVLINIALDPILIKVLGMGIEGAALATILAQAVVFVLDMIHFKSKKSIITLSRDSFKMSFDIIPEIFSVGISGMVMQIMPAIQMSIMFKILSNYGGNDSVIIMGASYRVMTFAFIALWGISQGIQPVIGANYGANKFDRIKKTFLSFTGIALGISFSFWLFFMLFPKFILSWFITDNNIIIHGVTFYRIFLSVFLLYGLMPMAITFFQAIGKGGKAAILVVGRQILFFIPLILILPIFFGELGAWLAMPIGDFLTLILSLLLIKKTFDNIKTKKREFETLTSQATD